MKYYKIILDNSFIGVVYSGNFIKETTTNHRLIYVDENRGQFVDCNGLLYRDYWMLPIIDTQYEYTNANIIEISEEEYNTIKQAIDHHEEIIIDDDDEEEEPIPIIPQEDPDITIEFVRESKLKEMSNECKKSIENGFDILLSDGGNHHFSLTTQDQLNLMALSTNTDDIIPYHADGESTKFFSAADIKAIIKGASDHKTYQTTYYNSLREYINSLSTIEEIAAITYGVAIPEEYKSDVLKILDN